MVFHTKKNQKNENILKSFIMRRRRTSVVPEIRILAPSLERGLDESSQKYRSKDALDDIRYIHCVTL